MSTKRIEMIRGTVAYPEEFRVTLRESTGKASWLIVNELADSPLGSDDLVRAAERCRVFRKKSGDPITVRGIRGKWWSGQPVILVLDIEPA